MKEVAGESLIRNSAFLAFNVALTAVCGFASVSLLAHLYSAQAVGLSAAAVSAATLIASITQFGVNLSLPRFLPVSAYRSELINTVVTVTILSSVVGAIIFLVLPVAAKLYALGGVLFAGVFVVCTSLDAAETQLESVLIADRASHNITLASIVTNVVKVGAPVVLVSLGVTGAYISRIVVGTTAFVILAVVLGRRGHRFKPTLSLRATRELHRFSAGAYIGSLLGGLPLMVTPIIILIRFGPSQSAYWFTAVSIASLLYQLPGVVGRVLLAEAAQRASERKHLIYRATKLVAAVMFPVLAVAYIAAPLGLSFFGKNYAAESLTPLRWLIIAGIGSVINSVSSTILYLAKKTFVIALINGIGAVAILGLASAWAHGASDVALCWLAGEVPHTALFIILAAYALHQVGHRWEHLGADDMQPAPWGAEQRSTPESQQAGLEMLFRLATLQATGPVYGTGQFSAMRSPGPHQPSHPGFERAGDEMTQ